MKKTNKHAIWILFLIAGLFLISSCTKTDQTSTLDIAEKLYAADPARQMVGKELPQVSFTDLVSGKTITAEELKSKTVLINSMIIGCPSCLEEIKKLNQLYDKYGDRLTVIELDINPKDKPEQLLKVKEQLNGRDYIWAISAEAGQALSMPGPDYTYIIKNGKVVYADSFVVPVERLDRFVQEALQ